MDDFKRRFAYGFAATLGFSAALVPLMALWIAAGYEPPERFWLYHAFAAGLIVGSMCHD